MCCIYLAGPGSRCEKSKWIVHSWRWPGAGWQVIEEGGTATQRLNACPSSAFACAMHSWLPYPMEGTLTMMGEDRSWRVSTMVTITTVWSMQAQPQAPKLPEHSLKWIKWPIMRSSKDVVGKAKAPLNTAAGCQNPQPHWWAIWGEASRDYVLSGEGKVLQAVEAWPPAELCTCCLPHILGGRAVPPSSSLQLSTVKEAAEKWCFPLQASIPVRCTSPSEANNEA